MRMDLWLAFTSQHGRTFIVLPAASVSDLSVFIFY